MFVQLAAASESAESTEVSALLQLISDLRAQNTQLAADCEARIHAERLDVERSVREECSRNESGIADRLSQNYEDRIQQMREEHEACLDEVTDISSPITFLYWLVVISRIKYGSLSIAQPTYRVAR